MRGFGEIAGGAVFGARQWKSLLAPISNKYKDH